MRCFLCLLMLVPVFAAPLGAQAQASPSNSMAATTAGAAAGTSPQQESAGEPAGTAGSAAKATSLPLDAGEPFGLALKGGIDRYNFRGDPQPIRTARLEWGMQKSAVNDLLKPPAGSSAYDADKGLSCLPEKNGASSCFPNVSAPWSADFGDSFGWDMQPFLKFTPAGEFYSFDLLFGERAFADTRRTLMSRLGKPTSAKSSTVQNRMGATFDQEILEWKTAHTYVFLIQRNPADLTKGALHVTYVPLEKLVPSEPAASAPF